MTLSTGFLCQCILVKPEIASDPPCLFRRRFILAFWLGLLTVVVHCEFRWFNKSSGFRFIHGFMLGRDFPYSSELLPFYPALSSW